MASRLKSPLRVCFTGPDSALAGAARALATARPLLLVSAPGLAARLGLPALMVVERQVTARYPRLSCRYVADCGPHVGLAVAALGLGWSVSVIAGAQAPQLRRLARQHGLHAYIRPVQSPRRRSP